MLSRWLRKNRCRDCGLAATDDAEEMFPHHSEGNARAQTPPISDSRLLNPDGMATGQFALVRFASGTAAPGNVSVGDAEAVGEA